MSFSSDIKDCMISEIPNDKCCRQSLLLGIITARGEISENYVSIKIDGDNVLALSVKLIEETYGKAPEYSKRMRSKSGYTVTFHSSSASNYINLLSSGIDISEICRCSSCKKYFLQGIFLASGTVSNPEKCFFIEIAPLTPRIEMMLRFFEKFELPLKVSKRNGTPYIYCKDGNTIADFFALLGDNGTTFEFLNSKIEKQIRQETNRLRNCETNNIAKTVNASAQQVEAIRKLTEMGKLSCLPEELLKIAEARLEYGELSLSQLAYKITPPISKSGLNHRLKKIMEYAHRVLDDRKN